MILNDVLYESIKWGATSKQKKIWVDLLTQVTEFLGKKIVGAAFGNIDVKLSFKKMPGRQYAVTEFKLGETKKFNLKLNTVVGIDMLINGIAHELIHIKQVATGELEYKSDVLASWLGADIPVPKNQLGKHYLEYRELPWEIEAHRDEKKYAALVKSQFKAYRLPGLPDFEIF